MFIFETYLILFVLQSSAGRDVLVMNYKNFPSCAKYRQEKNAEYGTPEIKERRLAICVKSHGYIGHWRIKDSARIIEATDEQFQ